MKAPMNEVIQFPQMESLKLTPQEKLTLALLRSTAGLLEIKQRMSTEDLDQVPSLRDLIETAERVVNELGFGDQADGTGESSNRDRHPCPTPHARD